MSVNGLSGAMEAFSGLYGVDTSAPNVNSSSIDSFFADTSSPSSAPATSYNSAYPQGAAAQAYVGTTNLTEQLMGLSGSGMDVVAGGDYVPDTTYTLPGMGTDPLSILANEFNSTQGSTAAAQTYGNSGNASPNGNGGETITNIATGEVTTSGAPANAANPANLPPSSNTPALGTGLSNGTPELPPTAAPAAPAGTPALPPVPEKKLTPEEQKFMAEYEKMTPEQKANVDRFLKQMAAASPEEKKQITAYLDAQKPATTTTTKTVLPTVTVKSGDTIYGITAAYNKAHGTNLDFRKVEAANMSVGKMVNGKHYIYAGNVITIPDPARATTTTTTSNPAAAPKPAPAPAAAKPAAPATPTIATMTDAEALAEINKVDLLIKEQLDFYQDSFFKINADGVSDADKERLQNDASDAVEQAGYLKNYRADLAMKLGSKAPIDPNN